MTTPTRQQPRPLTREEFNTLPPDSLLELRHGQEWRAAKVLGHSATRIHVGLLMGDHIVGYLLSWIEIQDSLRHPAGTQAPSLQGVNTALSACSHCGSPSRLTCQFPVADDTDQCCGKPLCRKCTRRAVTDRDLCPKHYTLLTQPPGSPDEP